MSEENKYYLVKFNDGRELYTKDISEKEVGKDSLIYIRYIYTEEEEQEREKELSDAIELISLIGNTRDEAIASQEEAIIMVARLSQTITEAAPSKEIRDFLLSFLPVLYNVQRSLGNSEDEKKIKTTILWLISFLPKEERGKYAAAL